MQNIGSWDKEGERDIKVRLSETNTFSGSTFNQFGRGFPLELLQSSSHITNERLIIHNQKQESHYYIDPLTLF